MKQSLSNWQWLNVFPLVLFYLAIHANKYVLTRTESTRHFRRYHIFNSPIFFLGMILIIILTQNKYLATEKSVAVENTEIVWVLTMLVLALFQVFELFETNQRRKSKIAKYLRIKC